MNNALIKRTAIICGGGVLLLLAGCSSNNSESAGFDSVARDTQLRCDARPRWSRDEASATKIRDAVEAMLRDKISCNEAVQIGLLNNQNLQATFEDLGISHAQLIDAGLMRNPTISAEVRFPKYVALPFDVDLVQSFLDALMIPVRKQVAEADYRSTQARVTAQVVNLAADVRIAFYRTQAAGQTVELRQKIVQSTGASLEAALRLHEAGNITDLVLFSQQAMEAQSRIDLATANSDQQEARENLSALLGLWGDQTQWAIEIHLPDLPDDEVQSAGLESLAIRQREDLQSQRAQVEVASASLDLTRRTSGISDLTVGGRVIRDPDGDLTAGPSISVPLPIFNQGQAAVIAAQARLAQARKRYAALAVQIRSDVRRDRGRMLAARQRAAYYAAVVLPLRRQIVQQTQLESNAMMVGLFELLMARQNEIDAARQWIESLRDYWVARVELERAVGGRLTVATSSTRPSTQPVAGTDINAEPDSMHMAMPKSTQERAHP